MPPIGYPGNSITKAARARSGGGFESAVDNAAPQAGLTLASANYVPRKLNMLPIYPVDASETDEQPASYALFKNARAGLKYEVPIVVAFGAYPFNARKITGPSWLTVGGSMTLANGVYTESDDYLTISGTPPEGSEGTYTVTVGLTDQDYQRGANPSSELQISYTLTVSNNMHVFVAPTATGAGDGSTENDCAAYTELYQGDTTVSLGQGKIAVWRGGSYSNSIGALNDSYHAVTHMAYPGETPVLNLNNGSFSYQSNDTLFVGFKFINGLDKAINAFTTMNNLGFWRCTFDVFSKSTNDSTNQSALYFSGGVTPRKRAFIRECVFSSIDDVSAYLAYRMDGFVVERNRYADPVGVTERSVLFPKSDVRNHTIRRNSLDYSAFPTSTDTGAMQIYLAESAGNDSESVELCYNKVICGGGSSRAARFGQASTTENDSMWSYRNTYVDGSVEVNNYFSDPNEVTIENDVIQNSAGGPIETGGGTSGMTVTGDEAHGTSGIVDASGNLSGAFRTNYLGLRGYEIAGDAQ